MLFAARIYADSGRGVELLILYKVHIPSDDVILLPKRVLVAAEHCIHEGPLLPVNIRHIHITEMKSMAQPLELD